MKTVPLFYYPTTKVFIDDDKALLQTLKSYFSQKKQKVETFSSSSEFKNFLDISKNISLSNELLNVDIDDEYFGTLKRTPINFDVTKIVKLHTKLDKYKEISTIILDYNMPSESGVEIAKDIASNPASKILLTGEATQEDVISAFNQSLIDKYLQKGTIDFIDNLESALEELTIKYFEKLTQPLLKCLQVENILPLDDEKFVSFFNNFIIRKDIVEYYLIDKNGSYLCIDSQGNKFVLVVQTNESLDVWKEEYSQELSEKQIIDIDSKCAIPFFGIGKEASHVDLLQWSECFYQAKTFQGRTNYLWSLVELEKEYSLL